MMLSPEMLRWMTHGSLWLETLGPVLLFLPFNVGLQRLVAVGLFVMFHMGLGLSLELGNFPWVCMVAWIAILPGSFWDRLAVRLSPAGEGITVVYDPERPWARSATSGLLLWLFLWDEKHEPASPSLLPRLREQGGWGVLMPGRELTGTEALTSLVAASPVFYPLALLCPTLLGRWVVAVVGWRGRGRAKEPARPAWAPPGGSVVNAVVLFVLVYIVLLNTRNFGYSHDRAFPDPNRPPERWQHVLPNLNYAFGAALGIDQGWGLFAPRPGKYVGWYHAVGIREDGQRIDLLNGGVPIDDQSKDCKPAFPAGAFANGRWRKLMQNTAAFDLNVGTADPRSRAYPYLLPGFAHYLYREWNSKHEGKEALVAVELIWWKEESRPPGEEKDKPQPDRIRLLRFEPCASPARQYRFYLPDNPTD
jgi:hypothetical protein